MVMICCPRVVAARAVLKPAPTCNATTLKCNIDATCYMGRNAARCGCLAAGRERRRRVQALSATDPCNGRSRSLELSNLQGDLRRALRVPPSACRSDLHQPLTRHRAEHPRSHSFASAAALRCVLRVRTLCAQSKIDRRCDKTFDRTRSDIQHSIRHVIECSKKSFDRHFVPAFDRTFDGAGT